MPEEPTKKEVTADEMQRWNNLIRHAKKKGYAGRPELDHDENLRKKIFDEYNKENPDSQISIDRVKDIQNEIQTYKAKALANIKKNPASYAGKPETFMEGISQVDGIWGQKTSQWEFPLAYWMDKKTGEKKKLGFAPKVNMTALNAAKSVDEFYKK